MDYKRIYDDIIKKAVSENRIKKSGVYYEKHHIIPKAMGGSNDSNNLALLTAKEHFVCHHLLIKFNEGEAKNKLCFAFWAMCNQLDGDVQRHYRVSASTYSTAKGLFAVSNSKLHKGKKISPENVEKLKVRMTLHNPMRGRTGNKNPLYKVPRSAETISKIKETKLKNKHLHPSFLGYYHTPYGVFTSSASAGKANNIHATTARSYCVNNKSDLWWFEPKQSPPTPPR